ncbi:AraC family transcriptional regulator [Vibrio sp. 404]|uniref:AraC family transcriptional regulator n=1 Tax=Vibrio marinisediminis TaxID=2758441 RepID=A0A7W2FMZ0_9VIBR|nr:AraC family transcriptional regulator [Vibrio marinisediminis]MBA5761086.1 AraC family transcriptional regulator [Vibrio marinisediminis]
MKSDTSVTFKQSTLLPWVELRIANQSSACYESHSHDEFSFGIIDHGVADYRNRKQTHRISQGDVVTINPADVHSCNPDLGSDKSNAWSYRMLFVDTLKMGQIQSEILPQQHIDYLPFLADFDRSLELKQRFIALFNALQAGGSTLETEVSFYNFIESSFAKSPSKNSVRIDQAASLLRVREKLLDEVDAQHQLDQLAQEAGISRYQLIRSFKNQFGLPPHAYLMDEKIKRSKHMLKRGQKIAEVALLLGFSDQAHFQRHFKRKLSVTPKFYQSHFVDL